MLIKGKREKGEGKRKNAQSSIVTRALSLFPFSLSLSKFFLLLASCFFSLAAPAQCAMCRAALQGEGNIKKAEAVNNGIVYLMVIPYLLVGVIGYVIYRMYNSRKSKS